jgi:putative ABC transport system permease protein
MKWKNLIKVAFKMILKNRMRSFLTMLGMIIGVASVIALLSVGAGTQSDIESKVASLGTNLIVIMPGWSHMGGVSRGAGSHNTLSLGDVDALQKECPLINEISPVVRVGSQVIAGRNNWSTQVNGVAVNYTDIRSWPVQSGGFFNDRDVKTRNKVAILGQTVVQQLFPGDNPVGARIRIGNVPFLVTGVLGAKGQNQMGQDQDDIILMPWTTALYRLSDGITINSIIASAVSADIMDQAQADITSILRRRHHISEGQDDDFFIRSQTEINQAATSITGMLTVLLGSIAGVSLIVGGIGIMNIMLVSVTERTRGIGIRLAIGARESDVLVQFLIEAVIISLLGGVLGILAGIGAGALLSKVMASSVVVQPGVVSLAFFVSGAIGVFFGFYPARKAAALDPIEALRYE